MDELMQIFENKIRTLPGVTLVLGTYRRRLQRGGQTRAHDFRSAGSVRRTRFLIGAVRQWTCSPRSAEAFRDNFNQRDVMTAARRQVDKVPRLCVPGASTFRPSI